MTMARVSVPMARSSPVTRIRAEDTAFDVVYARLWWPMLRLATGLVDDRASAEDVVQDAFAAAHRRWHRIEDDRHAAYLRTAVLNTARSVLRRRKTSRAHLRVVAEPPEASTDTAIESLGERTLLSESMKALPRRQHEVLVLRYIADLTDLEIAEVTGLSTSGVRSAAARGLVTLRTRMGESS